MSYEVQNITIPIKRIANVDDTLEHIKRIVGENHDAVYDLSTSLIGATTEETLKNDWQFVRDNVRYANDEKGVEQLRRPQRTISEGVGDCDCMSILMASLLINQGFTPQFNVTAYIKKGDFTHIYVSTTDNLGRRYVLDTVPEIPYFNYEAKPIIDIKKITMRLEELAGLGELDQETQNYIDKMTTPLSGVDSDFNEPEEEHFLKGVSIVSKNEPHDYVLRGTELFGVVFDSELKKARQGIIDMINTKSDIGKVADLNKELELIDQVIEDYQDDQKMALVFATKQNSFFNNFYQALLEALETSLNGFENDDEEIYLAKDLGRIKFKAPKIFKKLASKVGDVGKKVLNVVNKANPAFVPIRAALLAAVAKNVAGIGEKLAGGYMTEADARRLDVDVNVWKKHVEAREKFEKKWEAFGGSKNALKKAAMKKGAKAVGLKGIDELDELEGLGLGSLGVIDELVTVAVSLFKNIAPMLKKKTGKPVTQDDLATNTDDDSNDNSNNNPKTMSTSTTGPAKALPGETAETAETTEATAPTTLKEKVKAFWTNHKTMIIIVSIIITLGIIAFIWWRAKKKKAVKGKRKGLAGYNRHLSYTAKTRDGRTVVSQTYTKRPKQLALPLRGLDGAKKPTNRLALMHAKAKQLQKQYPKTQYKNLMKKASKMV